MVEKNLFLEGGCPKSKLGALSWGDIKILNIGSGDFQESPEEFDPHEDIGYVKLAQIIPDVFLDGVTKMIIAQAQWILHDDFHRVSTVLKRKLAWMNGKKEMSF